MEKTINPAFYTPLSVLAAGLLIAGAVYYGGGQKTPTAPSPQGGTQAAAGGSADISKVTLDGNPYIGDKNAPVTVAYWFDYQCPFCKRMEETVMPTIVQKYVDTGKVKIVFKDFQFLGADSQTLGHYGRAVWEAVPSKFYAWHKAIFDNQGTENTGWATDAAIQSITAKVLTPSEVQQVIALVAKNKDAYQKQMDADRAEGGTQGVTGTPSMLIGTQVVVGAQPVAAFEQILDAALKGK